MLGWLCNALETVDTEKFSRRAISLRVVILFSIKNRSSIYTIYDKMFLKLKTPGKSFFVFLHFSKQTN
jgi:hypothetical protein